MTLLEYASVAEIVAAIAVVISLVYVGIQVTDSTRAVRSAASNDANVAMQSWYLEVGGNRQISDLWIQTMRGANDLSPEDEFQFLMVTHAGFLGFQNSYLLADEGALDPSIKDAINSAIRGVKGLPGFELYWRQRKSYLHPGFAEYVEELKGRDSLETVDVYRKTR